MSTENETTQNTPAKEISPANETVVFINYYALIATVIFGLFGSALINFLEIPELKLRYSGIASLFGFVLILIIKLFLKTKNTKTTKLFIKIIAAVLLVALIYCYNRFDTTFDRVTFKYTDANDSTALYIKGTDAGLQPSAAFFKDRNAKKFGNIPSDQSMIDHFGGINIRENINHVYDVWTQDSVVQNKNKLINSYMIMALLFVGTIYFLVEALMSFFQKRKPTRRAGTVSVVGQPTNAEPSK